jgi:hypothetical protein
VETRRRSSPKGVLITAFDQTGVAFDLAVGFNSRTRLLRNQKRWLMDDPPPPKHPMSIIREETTEPQDRAGLSGATSGPLGLSAAEAARRLKRYGPNATVDVETPAWHVLLGKFVAPVPCLAALFNVR